MSAETPHVVVLAGPNGAGKTTASTKLLRDDLAVEEFVNADIIAQGLSVFNPEREAMAAGRIMLTRLKSLAGERASFAFETTLASRSFAPWLRDLIAEGYRFHLFFLFLDRPELAVERISERVQAGGHHVPDETVHRRYHGGLKNFFTLYQPMASSWRMFDNTYAFNPMLIAEGAGRSATTIDKLDTWRRLRETYDDS